MLTNVTGQMIGAGALVVISRFSRHFLQQRLSRSYLTNDCDRSAIHCHSHCDQITDDIEFVLKQTTDLCNMSAPEAFPDFSEKGGDDGSISGKESLMSEDEGEYVPVHRRTGSVSIDGSASPKSIDYGSSDEESDSEKQKATTVSSTARAAARKRVADDEAGSGPAKRFMSRKSVDDEESDGPVDEQGLDFDARMAIYDLQSQAAKAEKSAQRRTHPLTAFGFPAGLSSLTCSSAKAKSGDFSRQQRRKTTIEVLSDDPSGSSDDDYGEEISSNSSVSGSEDSASSYSSSDLSSDIGDEEEVSELSDFDVNDDRSVAERRTRRSITCKSYKDFSSDEADQELADNQVVTDVAIARPRLNLRQKNQELEVRIKLLEDIIWELTEENEELKRGQDTAGRGIMCITGIREHLDENPYDANVPDEYDAV